MKNKAINHDCSHQANRTHTLIEPEVGSVWTDESGLGHVVREVTQSWVSGRTVKHEPFAIPLETWVQLMTEVEL